jgi:ATP-dependent Clp protease protease subunit
MENRAIHLDDDVDAVSMGLIIRGVLAMDQESAEPIHVYICTYGGTCYDGLGCYDVLRAARSPIYTYGVGKVMSMGTWLILAGDTRFAYPNTTFMWHSIGGSGVDGKLFEQDVDVNESKRLYGRLLEIYAEHTNKDKQWWRRWIRHQDQYGSAEDAKELGFITEIIGEK